MKLPRLQLCTLALLLIGGCMSLSPHFDQQVGLAVNTARAQQVINADASRNTDPVSGCDRRVPQVFRHAATDFHGH
jgi:hypothetical protein